MERVADEHRHVREAVDLVDREPLAVKTPECDAAALRPDVDGDHGRPVDEVRAADEAERFAWLRALRDAGLIDPT